MLPEDLIYEISLYLLPKNLIKLSLCSNYLRRAVLNDQRIWRAQYYKEWPAFFTPNSSVEDALFPAPTWIQAFLMRKLSELNIEKQGIGKAKSIFCDLRCHLFQDLALSHDCNANKFIICKNLNQKVAEFSGLGNLSFTRSKIHCGNILIVFSEEYGIHCLSMTGEYTKIISSIIYDILPVSNSRFIGIHSRGVEMFTIVNDSKVQQRRLEFPTYNTMIQVYGRPGHFISINFGEDAGKAFTWSMWDFCTYQPELVMAKHCSCDTKIHMYECYPFADCDFVFLSYSALGCVYVYAYSFKEDRSKIFKITEKEFEVYRAAVFYTSAWNDITSRRFYQLGRTIWICFSGTTLNSLRFVFDTCSANLINMVQFSRRLLFVSSNNYCQVRSMHSGSRIWKMHTDFILFNVNINSRYFLFDDNKVLDFGSEEALEIGKWLYKLFE